MENKKVYKIAVALVAAAWLGACSGTGDLTSRSSALKPALSGAIFTTLVDGTQVNANIYEAKEDVYLDGGPGPNAPAKAAGLPEGDYFFQVTDPSGKDLLSSDHISCRKIHVNDSGVIDFIYAGTNYIKEKGVWVATPCQHNQGVDIDHPELGAMTVQLFPYDDTPNPGGVYKAWITPVADYAGDANFVPVSKRDLVNGEYWQPGDFHGFIPARSKTDNYKVKKNGKPFVPPVLTVRKFHDKNLNGIKELGEEEVFGWEIQITDPLLVTNTHYTKVEIFTSEEGAWTVNESQPAGTLQTVATLDGQLVSIYPNAQAIAQVNVANVSEETHEVVYGNVGLGQVGACKVYDRNGNGLFDDGEPLVPGWNMQLTGTTITGLTVGPVQQLTDETGCTVFDNLLPGTYTVTELLPANNGWVMTGAAFQTVSIQSSLIGYNLVGTFATVNFTNICYGTADFGTKGYWHNKNGLDRITQEVIDMVNGLAPYSQASSYFDAGDEPFDGFFNDGTPVEAVPGEAAEDIAPAGSAKAEISLFLVDRNADGDPREQLAQQLLAFIFNTQYNLDSASAAIQMPDGSWKVASELIDEAIALWLSGEASAQTAMKDVLDAFNNSDAVPFIHYMPCNIVYPVQSPFESQDLSL